MPVNKPMSMSTSASGENVGMMYWNTNILGIAHIPKPFSDVANSDERCFQKACITPKHQRMRCFTNWRSVSGTSVMAIA